MCLTKYCLPNYLYYRANVMCVLEYWRIGGTIKYMWWGFCGVDYKRNTVEREKFRFAKPFSLLSCVYFEKLGSLITCQWKRTLVTLLDKSHSSYTGKEISKHWQDLKNTVTGLTLEGTRRCQYCDIMTMER